MPYTQEETNAGQRKINGALCEVDSRVILTVKDILELVKSIAAIPTVAPHIRGLDFSSLEKALDEAEYFNKKVAEITPPGCALPPY